MRGSSLPRCPRLAVPQNPSMTPDAENTKPSELVIIRSIETVTKHRCASFLVRTRGAYDEEAPRARMVFLLSRRRFRCVCVDVCIFTSLTGLAYVSNSITQTLSPSYSIHVSSRRQLAWAACGLPSHHQAWECFCEFDDQTKYLFGVVGVALSYGLARLSPGFSKVCVCVCVKFY